ncbi:MAG TPA: PIN domain protein [Spirochaetes bacterium]|nr:PIN domain protein [Spirochaetota bacterium]
MKSLKLYLDTSVIGGTLDPEFQKESNLLFVLINEGVYQGFVSDSVMAEIQNAPDWIKEKLIPIMGELKILSGSQEALDLARIYINEKVVSAKFFTDALHVAITTVHHLDAIVSWNFKHIVNLSRIRLFNSVNYREGYKQIDIITPLEVCYEEF